MITLDTVAFPSSAPSRTPFSSHKNTDQVLCLQSPTCYSAFPEGVLLGYANALAHPLSSCGPFYEATLVNDSGSPVVSFAPGSIKLAENLSEFNPAALFAIVVLLLAFPSQHSASTSLFLAPSIWFLLLQMSLIFKTVGVFQMPGAKGNECTSGNGSRDPGFDPLGALSKTGVETPTEPDRIIKFGLGDTERERMEKEN